MYGFIAEEVASVDPHLAQYGTDGLPRNLDDRAILSVTVKAVQELASKGAKSAQDNWQDLIIALLVIGFIYQANEIRKLKK